MRTKIPLAFLCLFLVVSAQSQNLDTTIERYANQFGQEKAYLHFDKSSYSSGETIWYEAYLMSGIFAADDSKSFYIDWTDERGKLLLHSIVPVVYATASGQFDIPAGYTGHFLHVRAYTKWMLNFDSSFLYNKDIRILAAAGSAPGKIAILPTVQFFPEGGDAVAGIANKIAFKANDQWGRPVRIRGIVLNGQGQKTDSIRVIHDGMGYFFITPKPGNFLRQNGQMRKARNIPRHYPHRSKKGWPCKLRSMAINGILWFGPRQTWPQLLALFT